MFVAVRHTWMEERVFFLDEDGTQKCLPVAWTDARSPDVFVTLAAGRSPFRADDLIALAELIAEVRRAPKRTARCRADSAVDDKGIMP